MPGTIACIQPVTLNIQINGNGAIMNIKSNLREGWDD